MSFSVDSITVPGEISGKDNVPLYVFALETAVKVIKIIIEVLNEENWDLRSRQEEEHLLSDR